MWSVDVDIPLSAGKWGKLLLPKQQLSEDEYNLMVQFIEFLKPALVISGPPNKAIPAERTPLADKSMDNPPAE